MVLQEELIKREAELRRTMAGYFSHEIRNPLNAVMMGLEYAERCLSQGGKAAELEDTIHSMQGQCLSVVAILNDLLMYANEGMSDESSRTVCMRSLVEQVVGSMRRFCAEKEINLVLEMLPEHSFHENKRVVCKGDEEKLIHVLRTLLSNAIECTPKGSTVTVRMDISQHMSVSVPMQEGEDCQLHVLVTDEGPGLTEVSASKIRLIVGVAADVFACVLTRSRRSEGQLSAARWSSHRGCSRDHTDEGSAYGVSVRVLLLLLVG